MGILGQLFMEMNAGLCLQSSLDSLYSSDKAENHAHISLLVTRVILKKPTFGAIRTIRIILVY